MPCRLSSASNSPRWYRATPYTLDDVVEHLQTSIDGHLAPAPDEQVGIGERDVQAGDGLGHAVMLTGRLAAVQFHGTSSSQREAGQPLTIFSMTSAISACGPAPLSLQVSMTE